MVSYVLRSLKTALVVVILTFILFEISSLPMGFGWLVYGHPFTYYFIDGGGISNFSALNYVLDVLFWSVMATMLIILNRMRNKHRVAKYLLVVLVLFIIISELGLFIF
jgi:glucan phosphoethanolaminetransferase (alkaline phosphatase superfamily)